MPDKENQIKEPSQGGEQTPNFEQMYKESSAEGHRRYEQTQKVAVLAVKSNPKNLIELYKEDPVLAEKIAKKEYDLSYEDAKKQIEGFSSPSNGLNEDELVEKLYSKIEQKTDSQKRTEKVDSFYSKYSIDGDFKKDFENIYNDLIEGKKLSSENVGKYLDIAYREAKNTSKSLEEHKKAVDQAKKGGLTTGKGDGGKTPKDTGRKILKNSNSPSNWY